MDAKIRIATTDEEKAAAYALRYELYVEGQGLFQDEADHERRWLTDAYDEGSYVFLAEVDGRVVGTSRLTLGRDVAFSAESREAFDVERFDGAVAESDMATVSRLVVRPELRGGSLGFKLLAAAFERAALEGAELVLGNCEPHLLSHYLKLGSRPYGDLYNHPRNGALVRIVLVTGDLGYLRQIDSPMLPYLSRRTKPVVGLEEILARIVDDVSIRSEELDDTVEWWRSGRLPGFSAGSLEVRPKTLRSP